MKKVLSIILIGTVVFTFSSCKKCMDCSYTYVEDDYEYTYTYEQYCGTKKNRQNFEDMVQSASDDHAGEYACSEE
jgi:hypothetical protein